MQFSPDADLLFLLRSGDLLCQLVCEMYKSADCVFLEQGIDYTLHKIVFFLELCKSLRMKRSLLFRISDILVWPANDPHKKSALTVLRTLVALEKHARKTGWEGPKLELKGIVMRSPEQSHPHRPNSYHSDAPKTTATGLISPPATPPQAEAETHAEYARDSLQHVEQSGNDHFVPKRRSVNDKRASSYSYSVVAETLEDVSAAEEEHDAVADVVHKVENSLSLEAKGTPEIDSVQEGINTRRRKVEEFIMEEVHF